MNHPPHPSSLRIASGTSGPPDHPHPPFAGRLTAGAWARKPRVWRMLRVLDGVVHHDNVPPRWTNRWCPGATHQRGVGRAVGCSVVGRFRETRCRGGRNECRAGAEVHTRRRQPLERVHVETHGRCGWVTLASWTLPQLRVRSRKEAVRVRTVEQDTGTCRVLAKKATVDPVHIGRRGPQRAGPCTRRRVTPRRDPPHATSHIY